MHPKDADGLANSVDPDQTASSEAVWSWSALFAETYLSQNIEFVRYGCIILSVSWEKMINVIKKPFEWVCCTQFSKIRGLLPGGSFIVHRPCVQRFHLDCLIPDSSLVHTA